MTSTEIPAIDEKSQTPLVRSRLGGDVPGSSNVMDDESKSKLPRGRHDLTPAEIKRRQRERLIHAMARTVAKRGYAATTVTAVCNAAKVSTRAFYVLFRGKDPKDECFIATFDRGAEELQRSVGQEYAKPASWPVRMRRGLEALLRLLADEPAFANLAIVEMLAAGPPGRERVRKLLENFQRFFDDAPRQPGQPRVPRVVVESVVAGVFGLLFNYVSTQRTAELPDLLPEITYFVLVPFIGPRAAAEAAGLPSPE